MTTTPTMAGMSTGQFEAEIAMNGADISVQEAAEMEQQQQQQKQPQSHKHGPHHELFLHPQHGQMYLAPMLFEHAMDSVECENYYSVLASYATGGALRRPNTSKARQPLTTLSLNAATQHPPSILRQSKRAKTLPEACHDSRSSRRCSFAGLSLATVPRSLVRSKSSKGLDEQKSNVSFDHFVEVYAIPAIADMPYDVQAALWMSRDEMQYCIHEAALAKMEEQLALRDQFVVTDLLVQQQRGRCGGDAQGALQRQESSDSVIEEYLQSVAAAAAAADSDLALYECEAAY
jgi:hypothetical protein